MGGSRGELTAVSVCCETEKSDCQTEKWTPKEWSERLGQMLSEYYTQRQEEYHVLLRQKER